MVTLGEFACRYSTNQPPEVVLTVGAFENDPLRADGIACESQDAASFRWRTDLVGIRSDLDDQCFKGLVFEDYGEKMIEVEVVDRWGFPRGSRSLLS